MEWMKVIYEDEEVKAANLLDGVLVSFFPDCMSIHDSPWVFVPGWEVVHQGDMDAPNFRKRPKRLQVFGLELREKE